MCIGLAMNGLGPVGYWMRQTLGELKKWSNSFEKFVSKK